MRDRLTSKAPLTPSLQSTPAWPSHRTSMPTDGARPRAAERLDRLPVSGWLGAIMALLFLSWLIESYDVGLTGAVLPSLTHQFSLSTGMKSLVAISANIGIVIGIVPAGRLADRFGRRKVLIVGTISYAVLTFVTGLSQNAGSVVGLRILDGIAMGAVFPIPYVFACELCPPHRRGCFIAWADSFLSIGYFLSPLLAFLLIPNVADTTGWRVMFFIGGLPILFAIIAWRYLPESPRWYEAKGQWVQAEVVLAAIEAKAERSSGHRLEPLGPDEGIATVKLEHPLRSILTRPLRRRSLTLWATFGGTFFIFYSIQIFMPTAVTKMGYTLTSAFAFTAVIVGVSIPGKLLESWIIERWGRKPVIITFTLVAAAASFAFGFVRGAVPILILGCLMSFFGIAVDPAVKTYTSESYPTEIRAWGVATTEGFGRLISGVVGPSLIPLVFSNFGVAGVYSLVGSVALIAVVVVAVFGRETHGMTLEQSADPSFV
ncbi:MAG: MFS transporter [Acidimicrobiales bacterium]